MVFGRYFFVKNHNKFRFPIAYYIYLIYNNIRARACLRSIRHRSVLMRFNRIIFLTVFLLVIFTLCLVGCSATSDRQDPVVKIQIDNIEEIYVYRGSELEIGDDVKLIVTKESGRLEEVTVTPDMIVGYNKEVIGKQTVKISYQNCETTFIVNVRDMEIQAIKIKKIPNNITVMQGSEEIPLSGIVLDVVYQDKTIEFTGLTMNNIEGYTKDLAPGRHKLEIIYSNCKASFYVTVKERGVKSIEIQEKPVKISYFVGDSAEGNDKFDPTGLVLKVNYDNNTSEQISYAADQGKNIKFEYDFSQVRAAAVVTVTYGGKQTSYTCVVAEPKVVRLDIKTLPVTEGIKLDGVIYSSSIGEIVEGDKIDWSKGIFDAIYDNGYVESNIEMDSTEVYLYYNNVMDSYVAKDFKYETVGNFTIKVKYKNYDQAMGTVNITVREKVPYRLELGCITDKVNKVYKDGDKLTTDFLKYNILYDNGTYLCDVNDVGAWKSLSATELADGSTLNLSVARTDEDGYQTINFNVNGVTAGYRIKVEPNDAKKLVLTAPKVDYLALGAAPTLEGASLYVEYENTNFETINPIPERYVTYKDPNGIAMAGNTFSEVGVWQGIVTYGGKSVTFDVNIVEPEEIVTSIILNVSEGERLEFAQFEDIDFSDYIIEVTNVANVISHVIVTEDMLYEYNPSKIGNQDVVLRYRGKTFVMPIKIVGRRAVAIEIKTAPKTEYVLGIDTKLDVSTLEIIRRYSDGIDSNVSSFDARYWTFSGYDLTQIGEQTVTVTYDYYGNVCTANFSIKVSENVVESISFDEEQLGLYEEDGKKAIPVTYKDDLNTTYIIVDYDDHNNPIYTVGEFYINVKYKGIDTPIKRTLKASYVDYDKNVTHVDGDGRLITLRKARVNYDGKSTEIYVKILDRVLVSIETFQAPDVLIYAEGQALKSDGGIIKRIYSDGTSDVLPMTNGLVLLDGYNKTPFTTAVNVDRVTQTVNVSYNGKSTSFEVTTHKKLNATLNLTNIVSFYGSVTQPIVSVTQVIASFATPDTTVEYYVDGIWTDVLPSIPGTYPLRVTVFANEYYNAGEYVSGENNVKSMTIARKVIDVKVSSYSKYYGEIDPTFEYVIDSSTPLVGDDVLAIKLSREDGEDVRFNTDGTVGSYDILWQTDTSVVNQNERYYINYSVSTAKFTIRQKVIDKNAKGEIVKINWTQPANLNYDGNAKAYSAYFVIDGSNYAIKPQDLIYRNSRNEVLIGAPVERGTYTVEVSANYKIMNDSGKITFSII